MQGIVYGIIVAGGTGSRFGGDVPKQYLSLERAGRPVLMYAIDALLPVCGRENIRVAVAPAMAGHWADLCERHGYVSPPVVAGGATRWESVRNALAALPEARPGDIVLVHDGARPAVPPEVVRAVAAAAARSRAAVPVTEVTDSLRLVGADGASHAVERRLYRAVQTPQGFDLAMLRQAYAAPYSPAFTDDASVFEAAFDIPVALVEGSPDNIKITHGGDLGRAAEILRRRR